MTTTRRYGDGAAAFTWHEVPDDGLVPGALPGGLVLPGEAAALLRAPAGRPGLELCGDLLLLTVWMASWDETTAEVRTEAVRIAAGHGLVVTAGPDVALKQLREDAEASELLADGPLGVLTAAADRAVHGYGPVLRRLSEAMEELEQLVFLGTNETPTERIYRLSSELLGLRKALLPLSDALDRLLEDEHGPIEGRVRRRLKEVRSRLRHVITSMDTLGNLLTNILQANLTQVSVRQNDDMRKISAWAAIITVPTLLAGIWGMNFRHMPELSWILGYPLAIGLMVLVCLVLFRAFRRSGWL
jgi:magnesium transporter